MKDYAGTFLLVVLTTMIGIGCYGAATHGAGERAAIEDLQRQLVVEARSIRDLEVELRTRARLPQLERWNEQVLKMSAPAASQFMGSPVQLINLVTPPEAVEPTEPQLRFALAPAEPEPAGQVVQVRFEIDEDEAGGVKPAGGKAGVVRAAFPSAAPKAALDASPDPVRGDAWRETVGEP